jgi:prepilin signal peptidase PulO-like enzyme (type II secretory pathway)
MTWAGIFIVFLGWFAIGGLLGGLINALADNLPVGVLPRGRGRAEAVLLPRCEYCGEPRRGWRALAVLQVLQGGARCGECTAPRKARDLLVELLMAGALSVLWMRAPQSPLAQAAGAVVLSMFVLATVIDFEHRLVLMDVTLVGGGLLLAVGALGGAGRVRDALVGAAVGAAVFLLLYLLGFAFLRLLRYEAREAALGFGDVLLAAWVGLAVGWPAVLMALLLAILGAGAAGLGILAWRTIRRQATQGATMAYGPYLALAAVVVYFFGADIARLLVRSP